MIIELKSSTRFNYWCCANNLKFNNIVFKIEYEGNLYGNTPETIFEFYNCISLKKSVVLRCDYGKEKLTNCYGIFKSGYATIEGQWNYKTNYITSTPKVDSTTYEIIDDEKIWENVGTGTNPDGSQANLGVYGGTYSWEYDDDIF